MSSHGDFVPENLLFDGSALWVIDWGSPVAARPVRISCSSGRCLTPMTIASGCSTARSASSERTRAALLAVRYATVVAMIAALYAAPNAFDRDPFRAHALLDLLPDLRREAGITR